MGSVNISWTYQHGRSHANTWTATSLHFQWQKEKCLPGIVTICRTGDAGCGIAWRIVSVVLMGGQWDVRLALQTQTPDTILQAVPHPASPALQPTALLSSTHIPNYIYLLTPYPQSTAHRQQCTHLALCLDGGLLQDLDALLLLLHHLGFPFVLPQELGIAPPGVL